MEEIITKTSPELEYDFQTSEVSWNNVEYKSKDIFGPSLSGPNVFKFIRQYQKVYEIPVE